MILTYHEVYKPWNGHISIKTLIFSFGLQLEISCKSLLTTKYSIIYISLIALNI